MTLRRDGRGVRYVDCAAGGGTGLRRVGWTAAGNGITIQPPEGAARRGGENRGPLSGPVTRKYRRRDELSAKKLALKLSFVPRILISWYSITFDFRDI
jgi:hypothetical protein